MRDLTMEQAFDYQVMKSASNRISKEQAIELLQQAFTQLYIKTNIVNNLVKSSQFGFKSIGLTLEQDLSLRLILEDSQSLSREEVVNKLLEVMALSMAKDTAIEDAMKGTRI